MIRNGTYYLGFPAYPVVLEFRREVLNREVYKD